MDYETALVLMFALGGAMGLLGGWLAWRRPLLRYAPVCAAVAAERERCAAVARRWGETHADGETVNARNAASKIARGIEGPNVGIEPPYPVGSNDGLGGW